MSAGRTATLAPIRVTTPALGRAGDEHEEKDQQAHRALTAEVESLHEAAAP